MRGLEEPKPRATATPCGCVKPALETGNLLTEPIGYLESCFSTKNGTPRQPSICSHSRACLKIRKSIFNNPEHSLMGLEQFSHVWILFVFHKNGHLSCKAKVQPPRLNGAKTGVFSTRSPHRPNAIGLTLAKLEKVEGGAIYLSGIDMIHGTPVLDIKPYIADYDSPQNLVEPSGDVNLQNNQHKPKTVSWSDGKTDSCDQRQHSGFNEPHPHHSTKEKPKRSEDRTSEDNCLKHSNTAKTQRTLPTHRERAVSFGLESRSDERPSMAEEHISPHCLEKSSAEGTDERLRRVEGAVVPPGGSAETQPAVPHSPARTAEGGPGSVVPAWVRQAPVATLEVRFTPHAEMDLGQLSSGGETDIGQSSFKYFQSAEEAKRAIEAVLSADPRSVYRRKLCQDRLFYFTVDTVHVTCWFGDGFAEVLRIKPTSGPVQVT
ncbi:tRNA (adenine(37)-N6)-methyltransferase [Nycticebus coucang]|uniref:tRNA (adenine(37)-N6)-methyltransferase n=1 Tax=Nycticebus coucang TaxID=9470 RepID=UPI00234C75A1|nr:tRNA (adenine(37)-N6)-methyltransferase [Nycticebus coucang]XP_053424016.1 tRNA (adenine(37)-N6)-methyltransferase [Nycticebus coucang]